ncbi:type II toxin-antitoxin system VapC family toxin [Mucilaginibacter terrigena]|uniref:type II toxin-antitoxin system VapC family toxin n=1 Tax=Mucilaginibacter terrigena TaxID=2492395 RepID=UPI001396A77F|nr:PIN domain-containing protein [Mucilaginibacter terrigena]
MKKLFLDSDILLDLSLKRSVFFLPALNIIHLLEKGYFNAVTSSVAFVNIHYFLNKYDRLNKFSLLNEIRSVISIINVDEEIIDMALKSNSPDFEDAVQYYAAISGGCDAIITRNIKDYKQSTIPVLTAEQFLRTL